MMRFEFAVVADLSANVLSACLVIFLVLAGQAARETATREATRPPIEIGEAFETVRRVPLSGPERVRMLRSLEEGPALRLSLYADGVALDAHPSRLPRTTLVEEIASATPESVRLYVFRNEHYADTVRLLRERGLSFHEITVPEALRNGASGPGEAWSADFLRLVARQLEIQPFAVALAELLGSSGEPGGAGTPAAAAEIRAPSSLVERLRAGLALLLSIGAPLAGVLAVVAIERRGVRRDWAPDAGDAPSQV